MKIYVVTMYRWGDTENHSYVAGAFVDDLDKAVCLGREVMEYRGRKYEPEVVCFDHSCSPPSMTVVRSFEDNRPPINTSLIRKTLLNIDEGDRDGGKQDSV